MVESKWNNQKHDFQRKNSLGKVKMDVIAALQPRRNKFSTECNKPGECIRPECKRNVFSYKGSCFQGSHVNDDGKVNNPSLLAIATDGRLEKEMRTQGIDTVCANCHDAASEKRKYRLDQTKLLKLIPRPIPNRGDGKNILEELINNEVFRLKIACIIMEFYVRGWSTPSPINYGGYNTLRVVALAYFGLLADDYMVPTAERWDGERELVNRFDYVSRSLRYVLQDWCGTCAAATKPGTNEAAAKQSEEWIESDYACMECDYDLRNKTVIERQSIEADHDVATSKNKKVSSTSNFFASIDELCHAPYHCYFCHKRRTANQYRNNSWSSSDRDYTV